MAQRGPLVTAVVVVAGLIGLMAANASGGLVTAGDAPPDSENVAATGADTTSAEAPAPTTTEAAPPPTTTEPAPPPASTTEPPAPPKAQFPAEAVYAGRATGSKLAIAVAVKGDEAAAYLCDGARVESWLRGTAVDGVVSLKSKNGKTTLTGELIGKNVNGTVSIGGQEQQFSLAVAKAPAGLYRGENGVSTLGWILLPDGTQVGIARTASGVAPAPPLDPARGSVTVDGTRVTAEKVSGETTFG